MTQGIEAAAEAVRRGEVIAIPTDTVYGLGCDPADPAAVESVYRIKGRPAELELTLLAAGAAQLAGLVELAGEAARLAERFWPGPLSLVLPVGRRRLAVPRRGETLSVRVPAHELLRELLRRTGPLATTSANRHGRPPATTAAEAAAVLGGEVSCVVDGGPGGGRASTVVDATAHPPRVLREGPVSPEDVGRCLA